MYELSPGRIPYMNSSMSIMEKEKTNDISVQQTHSGVSAKEDAVSVKDAVADDGLVRNLISVPNSITCCNLISGCIATYFAFCGDLTWALTWIIIGAVFDFFDGMSARLLNVASPVGKELDSLADDITFGVAPSTMIFYKLGVMSYPDGMEGLRSWLPFVAYIMAAFSALRLAKFNLDKRQSMGFIGLPTPANALFWGGVLISMQSSIETRSWAVFLVVAGVMVSSLLLISELPMFALKFKHWGLKGNGLRYGFVAMTTVIFIVAVIAHGWTGFLEAWAPVIAVYVLICIILRFANR